MKSYVLSCTDKSKVAQAFVRFGTPGGLAEPLIRNGWSQAAFTVFLAQLAHFQLCDRKVDATTLAVVFSLVQAGNSSAAKQAVEKLSIRFDGDEKSQSVGAYWAKSGHSAPAADLSILGLD